MKYNLQSILKRLGENIASSAYVNHIQNREMIVLMQSADDSFLTLSNVALYIFIFIQGTIEGRGSKQAENW